MHTLISKIAILPEMEENPTPVRYRVPVPKHVGTPKRFPPRFLLRVIYFYHSCAPALNAV